MVIIPIKHEVSLVHFGKQLVGTSMQETKIGSALLL
jgi:hypothetical protein